MDLRIQIPSSRETMADVEGRKVCLINLRACVYHCEGRLRGEGLRYCLRAL